MADAGKELSDDAESMAIREELGNMSFEELQKLKEKLGTKVYYAVTSKQKSGKSHQAISKRANKNRPREVSAKRPVPVLRDVFGAKKKITRDPRFDDLSGEFDETAFKQSYKFLDDVRKKEKDQLQKELENETDENRKQQIRYLLKRMANQEKAKEKQEAAQRRKIELRKQLIERAKEGKKPYIMKKSLERNLSLREKYEQLKRTGKLDKYLERKRKKNASKDKRLLPRTGVHASRRMPGGTEN